MTGFPTFCIHTMVLTHCVTNISKLFQSPRRSVNRPSLRHGTSRPKLVKEDQSEKSNDGVQPSTSKQLFTVKYMDPKCHNAYGTIGKAKEKPNKLMTANACNTLIRAANVRQDTQMLHYIQNCDYTVLLGKEILMHPKCYRDYTRIVAESRRSSSAVTSENIKEDLKEKLREFVQSHVIEGRECVYATAKRDLRIKC